MRWVAILGFLLSAARAHAQVQSVTLLPLSRDFGYFPGDLVASTAIIDVGPDTALDRGSLPYAGPVTPSIDLRAIAVADDAIPGGRRITIRAQYQSFATPDEVSQVDVPGFQVAFAQGQKRLLAAVPGFGFAVSPFRHDVLETVDLRVLRPDHALAKADDSAARLELLGGSALACLSIICLASAAGWLPWARRRNTPFARAARHLRGGAAGPQALLLLHRAFDETAGERVLADDIERFLERAPQFAALRSDIVRFFDMSRACFFGCAGALPTPNETQLASLCRDLARAERR
jgi:mxaA protein